MNVRKPIDYGTMFTSLDTLMSADLPQMELYWEIGKLVSARQEKGAAVAAAEYLTSAYPDTSGFSPRNLRRMREFYRAYGSVPEVLAQAMAISWTQNTVILEAELTLQERAWYIRAARQFGWSKLELQRKIAANIHLEIVLDFVNEVCYTEEQNNSMECAADDEYHVRAPRNHLSKPDGRVCDERPGKASGAGGSIPNRLRCRQLRGNRQSGLPSRPPEAGGAWDQLCRENRPPAHKGRLCPTRPPDWDGPGKYPQYKPHHLRAKSLASLGCALKWHLQALMQRHPGWEKQAADGVYRPPRRCGGPLVYR